MTLCFLFFYLQGVTWRLALAIFAAVLGMFNFGYNTGVINSPQAVSPGFKQTSLVRVPFPRCVIMILLDFPENQ